MADGVINILRGKDAEYTIIVKDKDGKQLDLTGWTYVKIRHKAEAGGSFDVETPLKVGVDEEQLITWSAVPDAGSFKLKIGDETTTALSFTATQTDIENAINALPKQSGVTVLGDFGAGQSVITYGGGSGARDQATIEIVENTLVLGVNAVTGTVSVTTEGSPEYGIDVVDEKCGVLKVFLSETQTPLLAKGKNQDLDVCVRVGSRDLNIPILRKVLNVEASPFE